MYQRYPDPRGLISLYIDSGQFGKLINEILVSEAKRRREEAEKENERKMWELYLHSSTEKSYKDWHDEIMRQHKAQPEGGTGKRDQDMTDADIDALLKRLFPSRAKQPEAPA